MGVKTALDPLQLELCIAVSFQVDAGIKARYTASTTALRNKNHLYSPNLFAVCLFKVCSFSLGRDMQVPRHTCRGQRATCGSLFFPSTTSVQESNVGNGTWVISGSLEMHLRSTDSQ